MARGIRHSKNLKNASRTLQNFIHKKGKTLEAAISMVDTPLRVRAVSKRKKVEVRPWPVLPLQAWLRAGFAEPFHGFYFLGGFQLDSVSEAKALLESFWEKHRFVDSDMPKYPSSTIPFYIHGDEGRGQGKRPILVLSYQPILGWKEDGDHVNSKGFLGQHLIRCVGHALPHIFKSVILRNTYTTRLLYTVLPSERYAHAGSPQSFGRRYAESGVKWDRSALA